MVERFGPVVALVLLILGAAIVEAALVPADQRAFLSARNFANILGQNSYWGIVAVGMTFVIVLGGIDLSVGSMVALAAGLSVIAMNAAARAGWSPGAAVAAAAAVCLLGGTILGLINGLVVALGRIAPFIATLATLAIYRSLIYAPARGSEIRSEVPAFGDLGAATIGLPGLGPGGEPLPIRISVFVLIGLVAAAHLLLARTVLGRRIYAVGDNARAARYAGIDLRTTTIVVYTIAGLTCGVSALLNASRLNSVSTSSLGLFYELDAIAAVVIGGTRLQGGAGRVWNTLVGVLILGVVGNMLNMLGVETYYQGLVKGLIILAAVLVQPRKRLD
jgi:ribose transport system permease protein